LLFRYAQSLPCWPGEPPPGAISFDAVKQLVITKVERRPARLGLDDYPYLPMANVKTTSAADYAVLVSGRAA
jgi:hypothetical protein